MAPRARLTDNDLRTLRAAIDYVDSMPHPPVRRDLMRATGLAYSSVGCALKRLQRFGLIDLTPHISRSLRLMHGAREALKETHGSR